MQCGAIAYACWCAQRAEWAGLAQRAAAIEGEPTCVEEQGVAWPVSSGWSPSLLVCAPASDAGDAQGIGGQLQRRSGDTLAHPQLFRGSCCPGRLGVRARRALISAWSRIGALRHQVRSSDKPPPTPPAASPIPAAGASSSPPRHSPCCLEAAATPRCVVWLPPLGAPPTPAPSTQAAAPRLSPRPRAAGCAQHGRPRFLGCQRMGGQLPGCA